MYAVVPAAGRGSRLGSVTDSTPKPLVEVAGRPLLAHVFDRLAAISPTAYVVVIGYQGASIVGRFGERYRGVPIEYVRQPERLGLGDAIARTESIVDEPFVVCNGDNALETDLDYLAAAHRGAATLLVEQVPREHASETGVVVIDDAGRVQRVVEKPDDPPTTLVSAGAFTFSPSIFEACKKVEPSARGEYELSDAITRIVEDGRQAETVRLRGDRVNVNTPADLQRAERLLAGWERS